MNTRLNHLASETARVKTAIDAINTRASKEGRDITETEQTELDQLFTRAAELNTQVAAEEAKQASVDQMSGILARYNVPTVASEKSETAFRSSADYLFNFINKTEKFRTLSNQTLSDNPGIVPTPIVGDVIQLIDASRPVIASFPRYAHPGTKTWTRPVVTTNITKAAKQTNEFDELSSADLTLTSTTVTSETYGKALKISFQDADFTTPSAYQLILSQLANVYAIGSEAAVVSAFMTAADSYLNSSLPLSTTSFATVNTALHSAAAVIQSRCFKFPDTLWLSVDRWAWLAGILTTGGAPAFPYLNATNAQGTSAGVVNPGMNPLGLRCVISPTLPTGTMVMGNSSFGEVYEQEKGLVSATSPSTLSTELAVYGYVGTYFNAKGFISFTDNSATPSGSGY